MLNRKLYVYVITCDGGELGDVFYVGTWAGDNAQTRFLQHKNNLGSKFTRKYPPKTMRIVGYYQMSIGMRIENETTVAIIRKHGLRRVRGGDMLNMRPDCHQLSALQWWLPGSLQAPLLSGELGVPDPPIF